MRNFTIAMKYFLFISSFLMAALVQAQQLTDVTVNAINGLAKVSWESSNLDKAFNVYLSTEPFSDLTMLTPYKTVSSVKTTKIAGLNIGQEYYLSIIEQPHELTGTVNPIVFSVVEDTSGPSIGSVLINGQALTNTSILPTDFRLLVQANDDTGISAGNVVIGDQSFPLTKSSDNELYVDISGLTSGAASLTLQVSDSLANSSQQVLGFDSIVAQAAAVVITSPNNGYVSASKNIQIELALTEDSLVKIEVNGFATSDWQQASSQFIQQIELLAADNNIVAIIANSQGVEQNRSVEINVKLDETLPEAPKSLTASAYSVGRIKLNWFANKSDEQKYQILRSTAPFTDDNSNAGNVEVLASIDSNEYLDTTPSDQKYFYAVRTVLLAANTTDIEVASSLSNIIDIMADSIGPIINSIEYEFDNQLGNPLDTGKAGPGKLSVRITTSEKLTNKPYFALVSAGNNPVIINLSQALDSENQYSGELILSSDQFNSGKIYPIFSATDHVANRGSELSNEVVNDGVFNLDVQAPQVSELLINGNTANGAGSFINNTTNDQSNEQRTLNIVYTFDEPLHDQNMPSVKLIQTSDNTLLADSENELTQISENQWSYSYLFSESIGAEVAGYTVQLLATDKLGNAEGTSDTNIQVYQGDIPPPNMPVGVVYTSAAQGYVQLTWQASEDADGYEVYRGSSADNLEKIATQMDMELSQQLISGDYYYSLLAYRERAGSLYKSALTSPIKVTAFANRPAQVHQISATLQTNTAGTQVKLDWLHAEEGMLFNVWRSASGIDNFEQAILIANNISAFSFIDEEPIAGATYWLSAIDSVGNQSAPIAGQVIPLAITPLNQLTVTRNPMGLSELEWVYPDQEGNGFNIYRLHNGEVEKLNSEVLTESSFLDETLDVKKSWQSQYQYQVRSVVNSNESEGVIVDLPRFEISAVSGAIRRGVFNTLTVEIANLSTQKLKGLIVTTEYVINDKRYIQHSNAINIEKNQRELVEIVIAGKQALSENLEIKVTTKQAISTVAESSVHQTITAQVIDDSIAATLNYSELKRGQVAKLNSQIENSSDTDIAIIFAQKNGSQFSTSSDVDLLVRDDEDNLLYKQPVKLISSQLSSLANNMAAVFTAGEIKTITDIPLYINPAWPDGINIELSVKNIHFQLGLAGHQSIEGFTTTINATLVDAPYSAAISNIAPATLYADGETPVVISGYIAANSSISKNNQPVDLITTVNGFERKQRVVTDSEGNFRANFIPKSGESGHYTISAIYPGLDARPQSGSFNVMGAGVSPAKSTVLMGRNFKYNLQLNVTAGITTELRNVNAVIEGEHDLYVQSNTLEVIAPGQSRLINLELASNDLGNGRFKVKITADGFDHAIGYTEVVYVVSDAKPSINSQPTYINSSVKVGEQVTDEVTITNNGITDLVNPNIRLQINTGGDNTSSWSDAPEWMRLSQGQNLQRLALGAHHRIAITASPGSADKVGDYQLRIAISGDNSNTFYVPVYHKVTLSGNGSAQFYIADNYTGTSNELGGIHSGVNNALVKIQNVDVLSETYEKVTNSQGVLTFNDIPAGRYNYQVTAFDHQKIGGQMVIKPDILSTNDLLMPVNIVAVSFEVVETSITDQYTVNQTNTFETSVPAAIVVFEPTSIELPDMKKGEIFTGELVMVNHGLLKAYGLNPNLPETTEYARFEFLGEFPSTLEPGEAVSIPYKVIAVRDFDDYTQAKASGAGQPWLNVADVSVTGFYYCESGVYVFVSPQCSFQLMKHYNPILGAVIEVKGLDVGGNNGQVTGTSDGGIRGTNGTVTVTISASSPSSSSPSSSTGSTTSGDRDNLADHVTNNPGSSSGDGATTGTISRPTVDVIGPEYQIRLFNGSSVKGCRAQTGRTKKQIDDYLATMCGR